MAVSVVMPALEIAQETGKLVAWIKKDGDTVKKGEPLLEVETDKAVVEVEALADGILAGVTGEAGTDIPVGKVIAWIVNPGEALPAGDAAPENATATVTEAAKPADPFATAPSTSAQTGAGRISPKARRLAKEHNVDVSAVHGSGPGGEILTSDIEAIVNAKTAAAKNPSSTSPATASGKSVSESTEKPAGAGTHEATHEALSSIGRLMAERTTQSWTTVPHFFVSRDVDALALNAARAKYGPEIEKKHAVKLTHTDLLIALVARALTKHPRINASWINDGIRLNAEINVAIAMAVNDGVVAAVIPYANKIALGEIATLRRDLTERARAGRLRPADISGGTFTISNLGMFPIDSFSAIITPPQAAILAVSRIADRVVPIDGNIGIRPVMSLTLSSDHRVLDGAKAASFMHELAEAIQEPEKCLE